LYMLRTTQESVHQKIKYPAVLSEVSRTLGSTYSSHTNYESPTLKIGLFCTPTAALYRINTTTQQIEYTDYLPFFQTQPEKYYARNARRLLEYELKYKTKHANDDNCNDAEIPALDLEIATSCKRYHEYIHHQMPQDFIQRISDDVITKILNKLEPDLRWITQEQVEAVLDENLRTVQTENVIAVKQSILDYILKNHNERIRLDIRIPPHHVADYGHAPLPYAAPASWSGNIQQSWTAITESSYFVNRGIIELLALWQNYQHYRLFGKPAALKQDYDETFNIAPPSTGPPQSPTESDTVTTEQPTPINNNKANHDASYLMPMTLQQFREQQAKHLEFVRNVFLNHWYNDAVNIMKKYVEENGCDSSEKSTLNLLSSVAAFMSRNLCEIVYESLKDCVRFFEQYLTAPLAVSAARKQQVKSVLDIENVAFSVKSDLQPVWKIGMELSRDGIEFAVPLDEVALTITDMIDSIVTCFDGIVRVEGKIFGLLENVENMSVFIDEDIRQNVRERILSVTSPFVQEIQYLQEMYSNEFAPLFAANEELPRTLAEIETNPKLTTDKLLVLNAFKAEIEKYQTLEYDVKHRAQIRLRMGIFEVECAALNALIVNHANELKNAITNHVASRLINDGHKLVLRMEDASKLLLEKPMNAQQLLRLCEYLKTLDASELPEWQHMSEDIGKQLTFLFETEHTLSHDLLRSVGRVSDWNKKIIEYQKAAEENSIVQREYIETMISEKTKQFEQRVKKMYQEVEDLQLLSEIRDTSKVDALKKNIGAIDEEKEYLNTQQTLLNLQATDLKLYTLLKDGLAKL